MLLNRHRVLRRPATASHAHGAHAAGTTEIPRAPQTTADYETVVKAVYEQQATLGHRSSDLGLRAGH